jgi:flagellin-like hook-associated protein FlgL
MATLSGLDSNLVSMLSLMRSSSEEIDVVSKRLSTGKRVNSAQDDPEAFFRAEGYSSRASDLLRLNANTSVTSRALKSAQSAFDTMKQQLNSLSQSLTEALLTKVDTLQARAVSTTGYASTGASLLGTGATRFNEGDVISLSVGSAGTKVHFTMTSTAPTGGGTLLNGPTSPAAGSAANPIAVSTVQDLIDQLGKLTFVDGTKTHTVTASLAGSQLLLTTDDTLKMTLETNGSGTALNDLGAMFSGLSSSTLTASSSSVTFDPTSVAADGLKKREDAYRSYVSAMKQFDLLARDAGVAQIDNLLLGDGNGGGNKMSVAMSDGDATGYDIGFATSSDATGLGLAGVFASRFGNDTDLQGALAAVTNALETVESRAKTVATQQQMLDNRINFNKGLAEVLNGAAGDLTSADIDLETVRLASLQANRQAAIKMIGVRLDTAQSLLKLL